MEMSNDIGPDKALAIAWGHFMRTGMIEEALLTASLARRAAAKESGIEIKDYAEDMLAKSADELLRKRIGRGANFEETMSAECSFCGKKEPYVILGTGAKAYICNECVAKFQQAFENANTS